MIRGVFERIRFGQFHILESSFRARRCFIESDFAVDPGEAGVVTLVARLNLGVLKSFAITEPATPSTTPISFAQRRIVLLGKTASGRELWRVTELFARLIVTWRGAGARRFFRRGTVLTSLTAALVSGVFFRPLLCGGILTGLLSGALAFPGRGFFIGLTGLRAAFTGRITRRGVSLVSGSLPLFLAGLVTLLVPLLFGF